MTTYARLPHLSRLWLRISVRRPISVATPTPENLSAPRISCQVSSRESFSCGFVGRRMGLWSHAAARLQVPVNDDIGRIRPCRARLKVEELENLMAKGRSVLLEGLRCRLKAVEFCRRNLSGGLWVRTRPSWVRLKIFDLHQEEVALVIEEGRWLSIVALQETEAAVGKIGGADQGGWVSKSIGGPNSLGFQSGSMARLGPNLKSVSWMLIACNWTHLRPKAELGFRIWDPGEFP